MSYPTYKEVKKNKRLTDFVVSNTDLCSFCGNNDTLINYKGCVYCSDCHEALNNRVL